MDNNESPEARNLKELALATARGFVSRPEEIVVRTEHVGRRVSIELRPHANDVGRLTGRHGAMFHAFCSLFHSVACRQGVVVHYRIGEDGKFCGVWAKDFKHLDDWPKEDMHRWFSEVSQQLFELPVSIVITDRPDKTVLCLKLDQKEKVHIPMMELKDALTRIVSAAGACRGRRVHLYLDQGNGGLCA